MVIPSENCGIVKPYPRNNPNWYRAKWTDAPVAVDTVPPADINYRSFNINGRWITSDTPAVREERPGEKPRGSRRERRIVSRPPNDRCGCEPTRVSPGTPVLSYAHTAGQEPATPPRTVRPSIRPLERKLRLPGFGFRFDVGGILSEGRPAGNFGRIGKFTGNFAVSCQLYYTIVVVTSLMGLERDFKQL